VGGKEEGRLKLLVLLAFRLLLLLRSFFFWFFIFSTFFDGLLEFTALDDLDGDLGLV